MTALIVRPRNGPFEVHNLRKPRNGEPTNKEWFRDSVGLAIRPEWVNGPPGRGWEGYWKVARNHLTVVAQAIALRDGSVKLEMHYNVLEKCDGRCQGATGDDCTCACEGKNHGSGDHAAWIPVGETTLIKSEGTKIVCRRLTREELI